VRLSSRRSGYSGTLPPRLSAGRVAAIVGLLALGLASGGCSFSYQLGSLFGKDEDKADRVITGTVPLTPSVTRSNAGLPPEADLKFARAAASEVMSKDSGAPWENPGSGARGMVTPLAAAYDQEGRTCRDFLASYVRRGTEAWLQGEACRGTAGNWEVRSMRPWKRT
jgi:surface antigen